MTQAGENALRLSVEVAVGVGRAFEIFTTDFDRIKPREHNLLGEPIAKTVLEPRVGGRLYDRGVGGTACVWGAVLAFDPPHRLVLAWNISPRWQLETDPDHASEVEITFTSVDDGHTRVDLEHRHLERHGDGWQGLRGALEAPDGWPLYLDRYTAVASGG